MGKKRVTLIKAIELYCKQECCSGDRPSWLECSKTECPLHKYRLGKTR